MRAPDARTAGTESSRHRLLLLLKTRGPMTAARLARRLGLTSAAVHQHLAGLRGEGVIDFTSQRQRLGRPAHLWSLTPTAHSRFPDSHAALAKGMLEAVRGAFGEEGLGRLAEERTRRQVESYRPRVPAAGDASLAERVAALARIRREESYMAEWGGGNGGELELVENHCPIATAARCCPHLCAGELALFRTVLGGEVTIDRVEHLLSGDPRCVYRISEKPTEGAVSADG
jgi:predicted ArsR family transcriptional regulator